MINDKYAEVAANAERFTAASVLKELATTTKVNRVTKGSGMTSAKVLVPPCGSNVLGMDEAATRKIDFELIFCPQGAC